MSLKTVKFIRIGVKGLKTDSKTGKGQLKKIQKNMFLKITFYAEKSSRNRLKCNMSQYFKFWNRDMLPRKEWKKKPILFNCIP